MRKVLTALLAAGISMWGAAAAVAGTNITSFGVSLTVLSRCVVSASDIAGSDYTLVAGDQTGKTPVSGRCTQGAPFTRTVSSAGYSQLVDSNANHRAQPGNSDTLTVTVAF